MKAYTYVKPGLASFVDVDKPVIRKPTDAIVRIVNYYLWNRSSYYQRRCPCM